MKVRTMMFNMMVLLCITVSPAKTQTVKQGSPIDELPEHITRLTHFGQRADWPHDRILFIEKTYGDVYEIELDTRIIKPKTHHYYHEGYTRALYLSNGDILLSGAKSFDHNNPGASRSEKNAELWVLKSDLSGPPIPLGEKCKEGPAVSRTRMRIAWTQGGAIYIAGIEYEDGSPKLTSKSKLITEDELFDNCERCNIETQNFRPPDENEIIFSAYNYRGGEVMSIDINTGKIRNYSDMDNQYDEPEGIFPDGRYTLVESDRHASKGKEFMGHQYIDIHKLALDGSGDYERITYFNDYPGYKASNPVVSDDGRFIAFQFAKLGDPAGVGRGIFIFDQAKYSDTANTR